MAFCVMPPKQDKSMRRRVSTVIYGLMHGGHEAKSGHKTHLRIILDTDQSEHTVESNGESWPDS